MFEPKSIALTSKAKSALGTASLVVLLSLSSNSAIFAADGVRMPVTVLPTQAEINTAKESVAAAPKDYKAHYALAELYRRSGAQKDAVKEYAATTECNPSFYVAYHQLALSNPDAPTVEAAIERLNKLKETKPHDLLLCVAQSELLEQRKEYYHAARTLIDLLYKNAVPDAHVAKVNARIRLLLGKAKDRQVSEKARGEEEDTETVPLPLPEASLRRNLHASKIKEPKVMPGVGHAPLLP